MHNTGLAVPIERAGGDADGQMDLILKGSYGQSLLVTYLDGRIIVIYECIHHLHVPFLHHLLQDHPESADKPTKQRKVR